MNNVLEQQRSAFEEIERCKQGSVDLSLRHLTSNKDNLLREHKVNELVGRIQSCSQMLLDLYRDTSGLRKKELADMSGGSEFKEFYSRLDDIKNYHRRHPYLTVEPMELEFVKYKPPADPSSGDSDKKNGKAKAESEEESLAFATEQDYEKLETMFSGEETLGRYLDLHTQHEEYVNLKEAEQIPYLRYIVEFYEFEKYPHKHKNLQYKEYVRNICEYLESFLARSNPLLDVQKLRREAITKFEQDWAAGKAKGWELTNDSDSQEYNELFCKACEKQFQTKATFDSHLGGRKHKKAVAKMETQGAEPKPERNGEPSKARSIAELEYIVREYAASLKSVIQNTRENVERKQVLTDMERDQEMLEENEVEIQESEDEDEEHIYNPLKLPLGWDGKPIPYWLYKLHGLGVEYNCEICGNYIYRGRKAFDKHFQESRHTTNMRRLGIPNTRQFHDITKIEDALALWEKIKRQQSTTTINQDTFEEFEDEEGNVFSRKTYEDLKRQGLI